MEILVGKNDKRSIKQNNISLAEKVQKSFKSVGGAFDETEKSTVKKLVQQLRQSDNPPDNESVKDLVYNLTNLALAITEDRHDNKIENSHKQDASAKKKLTMSNSEGIATHTNSADEFFSPGEKKYERKFHSLDKKLKRTNLMRRRESQALLEGIRKSRQSSSNIMADLTEPSQ